MLMNTNQAAQYLNVTAQRLRQWRYEGKGPNFVKMSGLVRYHQDDLDNYIALSRRKTQEVDRLLEEFGAAAG